MINSDALNARVIHVDSRMRASGEAAEDMTFMLNEPVHLPKSTVAWVTRVNLPVWENVSELNNKLYVREYIDERYAIVPAVSAAGEWEMQPTAAHTP